MAGFEVSINGRFWVSTEGTVTGTVLPKAHSTMALATIRSPQHPSTFNLDISWSPHYTLGGYGDLDP